MNDKDYKIIKDKAWEKVFFRMEKEGLVDNDNSRRFTSIHINRWIVASAAAVILALIIVSMPGNRKDSSPAQHLVSLMNNDNSLSLVKTLEDKSVVYLTGKTTLSYPEHFEAKERSVVLRGDAMFDVTHSPGRPFLIKTRQAIVQVVGTCFNVKSNNERFELGLFRGLVKVTDIKTGRMNRIKAGEKIIIGDKGILLSKSEMSAMSKYSASVKFKDETIANIIKVVNDNSTGQTICVSKQLANRRITVSFTNETPVTIAQLLCATLDSHYEINNHVITIQ